MWSIIMTILATIKINKKGMRMQETIIVCAPAFVTHIMYRAYKQYKGVNHGNDRSTKAR
ncbi:Uncharacterised protein [Chlamydia trachomatis]|nr:Uncharacterised protein [Chlamydia trachomatis]